MLKDAGLTTISFNLEIFDEESRQKICPGKSRVTVSHYLEALKYATGVFGRGQVSSWLFAGLEPKERTIDGIRAVSETGAIPFVTVFRPLIGTELEDMLPPAVDDVIEIFEAVGQAIREHKVNPQESQCGCVNCNCCSALFESIE
jgi:biotin synthase-related radical SAM superfamily protein